MVQAQPFHAFDDDVDRGLGGALEVGVFNTQNKVATCRACKRPRVQSRTDIAEMNKTSRRWCEARTNFGHAEIEIRGYRGRAASRPSCHQHARGLQPNESCLGQYLPLGAGPQKVCRVRYWQDA